MLRHTALFVFPREVTPNERTTMLKGLAYMRYECATVEHLDYGTDLFGGSSALRATKPYRRTPRWRSRHDGPPSNYDVALHLDFTDQAGNDAYNDDDVHHEVGEYNASLADPELTARADYYYEGGFLTRHGHVRHNALFLWDDDATDTAKQAALDAARRLETAPDVEAVTIGENIGTLTTDYDWILDLHVPDEQSCKQLLASDAYTEAMRTIAPATKYEWTARLSHLMRGI